MSGVPAGRLSIEIVAEIARLQKDLDKAKRVVNSASRDMALSTKAANDNFVTMGRSAGSAAGGISKITAASGPLAGAMGRLLAVSGAFAALNMGRQFLNIADQSKQLTAQLKLATSETGSFIRAQEDVRRIAKETRSDLEVTAQLYGKLQMNALQLGISQEQAARATETVAKAFKVSGASAQESTQSTRQLVQALQSGVLRGDEFNSMAEGAPRLQKLLADSLGVTTGELRKMAEEGQLTSDKLVRAFTDKKFTQGLDDEFRQLPVTFDEAMGQVRNAAIITFGAFDRGGQFSTQLANFVTDGSSGFADLESAAERFGARVSSEFAGIAAIFQNAMTELRGFKAVLDSIGGNGAVDRAKSIAGDVLNPLGAILRNSPAYRDAKNARATELAMAKVMGGNATDQFLAGGGVLPEQEREVAAAIAETTNKKDAAVKAAERLAEGLKRESEATEALIAGNYKAAAAYGESTAAGIRARIEGEAIARGMKRQADLSAYAAQQIRKYVSSEVEGSRASTAEMLDRVKAQEFVNQAVAAGTLSVDKASEALSNMIEQQKLMTVISVARANGDVQGYQEAEKALKALTEAQLRDIKARREAADLQAADQTNKNVAIIEKQVELQRRLGDERLKALQGLSGEGLENELARINDQYEREGVLLEYNTKIAEARRLEQWKYVEALEAEKRVRLGQIGQAQGQANAERTFEQNRRRTLDLANDVADLIGGKLGDAFRRLISVLDETFNNLAASLGGKFAGLMKAFSEGMQTGGAFGGVTGSRTGGAIGGGLGQVIGEKFLSKGLESIAQGLGKFAGPLASIAGGLVGGLIGGMLKSTPRASATISIIAGEAMDTSITGNKAKLKVAAGKMADGVISGLTNLANQLGGDLIGNARVSIGMRDGKYRVDPTGRGVTKTSKGAIDFGDDQAAAIAYALQIAIQQGVLGGLSASIQRLIQGDGDLQGQLEKALSFKSVFDELAKNDAPAKWAQDEVTRWHDAMKRIFDEAGATADELAALERLTGIKRAEAAKEAAEQIAATERKALERSNEIRDKTIELMEAQGRFEEAEAMARQARIDDAPDYLRAIQQQIELSRTLTETIEKFRGFSASIREFTDGLRGFTGSNSLAGAQAAFANTARMAQLGSEQALASFTRDAQAYLEAARASGTQEQYQRAMAAVLSGANAAMSAADGLVDAAQQQLDRIAPQSTGTNATLEGFAAQMAQNSADTKATSEKAQVALETSTIALNRMERVLTRVERDGTLVVTIDNVVPAA